MWQSSMLISLLVLAPEQIMVSIWVIHNIFYHKPITILEPLVVIISSHVFVGFWPNDGRVREDSFWLAGFNTSGKGLAFWFARLI